jgi:hypothetical protein
MKRLEIVFALALVALASFVGVEIRGADRYATHGATVVTSTGGNVSRIARSVARAAATVSGLEPVLSADAAPGRDLEEVRRMLRLNGVGTYINELLVERDSSLTRWPDRRVKPLRVWVQPASTQPDFDSTYVPIVRDAFATWSQTGIPVRFNFVVDSSRADVHVTWIDRFTETISGKTLWAHDDDGWIVEANIVLALHHRNGEPLDSAAVRAISLHEVGHLIGLDHTTDTLAIMTPKVRVKQLATQDVATARLLYSVPPGSLKK